MEQLGTLPLFIALFAIMYFVMIRPQQKKLKQHQGMIEALRKGDRVITQGGLIGKVHRVKEAEVEVDLAPEVRVTVVRNTISQVLQKTEPADS